MHPIEVSVTAENRIRSMIAIRECVRRLIEYQTEGYPDEDIQKEQAELNRLYDDYTKNTACFPAGVTAWPLARTPAIACCVLWRYWTRKATSNARRICSPSARSAPMKPLPAWTLPAKPLPYPSPKKRGWIWNIWRSCPGKVRKNWPLTCPVLFSVIFSALRKLPSYPKPLCRWSNSPL